VELLGLIYLFDPELDDVKVLVEVDMIFLVSVDPKIIESLLEVPFRIRHEFKLLNIFQGDYDIGLLWKFLWGFIADQDAFNWIQI
jgi:hypothetical protein